MILKPTRYIIETHSLVPQFFQDMRHIHPGDDRSYKEFAHNELVLACSTFCHLFTQGPVELTNALSLYPAQTNYITAAYPFLADGKSWELFATFCGKLMGGLLVRVTPYLPYGGDGVYQFENYALDHISVIYKPNYSVAPSTEHVQLKPTITF